MTQAFPTTTTTENRNNRKARVKMDLSTVETRPVSSTLNEYNINIKENYGLNEKTGHWLLRFTFDYKLEKEIEVRLTNYKYGSSDDVLTLEIVKCSYLSITCKGKMASLDMKDELVNYEEMCRLNERAGSAEFQNYLEINILPLIIRKIKYKKFIPQFRFFLSHESKDKPLMRTFENGLTFLGYKTWLDQTNMPVAARLDGALKVSIEDECSCLIAWLNKEYFESKFCKAELLYAKKLGKIILPFGVYSEIKEYLTGDLSFLAELHIYDTSKSSFFEVLRRIDDALFNFETLTI